MAKQSKQPRGFYFLFDLETVFKNPALANNPESRLKVYDAIIPYAKDGIMPDFSEDLYASMSFDFVRDKIDRANAKDAIYREQQRLRGFLREYKDTDMQNIITRLLESSNNYSGADAVQEFKEDNAESLQLLDALIDRAKRVKAETSQKKLTRRDPKPEIMTDENGEIIEEAPDLFADIPDEVLIQNMVSDEDLERMNPFAGDYEEEPNNSESDIIKTPEDLERYKNRFDDEVRFNTLRGWLFSGDGKKFIGQSFETIHHNYLRHRDKKPY